MTDRQKLVYDLSMQCVSVDLKRGFPPTGNPAAYVLDSFSGYVKLFNSMEPGKLDAALDTLKKV